MFNKCVKLNKRSVLLILFSYFLNHIQITSTAFNQMEVPLKPEYYKNSTSDSVPVTIVKNQDDVQSCHSKSNCTELQFPCINCEYNMSCTYGKDISVTCEAKSNINCTGDKNFTRTMICRYCFLTNIWEHSCIQTGNCVPSDGMYRTNCTVHPDVLCFGSRTFYKNIKCNWTQGIKWSTALIISITLGGFGADRFYLGHWQEGIGKLFSFGGLGVWTLIDVILISLHYLGPADGSLFI